MFVAPAQATFSGKNGKIAFERLGGTSDSDLLFTVSPDGTGETQLQKQGHLPTWSASGTQLAYECFGAICIADSNGNQLARYYVGPDSAFEGSPAWSPDGTEIAFDAGVPVHFPPPPEIWKMNADGTSPTLLTRGGIAPDWSPDGSKIAFEAIDSAGGITVMNADGSGRVRITDGRFDRAASWSPDGSRISFDRDLNVYTVNPDGSDLRQVTSGPDQWFSAVWSPDGTKFALGRAANFNNLGIYMINTDGSDPALIATDGRQPDWQPLPGPQRSDYKNASKFCKAESDFLGDEAFAAKYGAAANAHGKCVSQN
jgi:Tol biopolymer transport system component